MEKTYGVFIGRFQPIHKGHIQALKKAAETVDTLIILVGSYKAPPTIKNPFTFEKREELILVSLLDAGFSKNKIIIMPIRDYMYDNTAWVASVQNKVNNVVISGEKVALFGMYKDDTSWYLDMFPQWRKQLFRRSGFSETMALGATDVRESLFSRTNLWKGMVSLAVVPLIEEFTKTELFDFLVSEYQYIKDYKAKWSTAPHTPIFVTTDAVVKASGHVLLVERGMNPGKGLYALPGGFVDVSQRIEDSMIRELYEETKLLVPKREIRKLIVSQHVFDHPARSSRGRTITHAFFINLGKGPLPGVKAADDAAKAFWIPIADVAHYEDKFFEDHYHIINYFISHR